MKPTTSNLIRLAGLSALLGGACYVFVGLFHPPNVPASVSTTRWAVVHVVACAMCFFSLLGITGIYARQAKRAGWLGLAGYLLFSLWFVLIMGFSFVEAFILPRLTTSQPAFVAGWFGMLVGPATKFDLGALPTIWTLTAPLYMLGGLLFGITIYRARHPAPLGRRAPGRRHPVGTDRRAAPQCVATEDRHTGRGRVGMAGIRAVVRTPARTRRT